MKHDNSDLFAKLNVRYAALDRVDDFSTMWDVCCGDGYMYEHLYRSRFSTGVYVDKRDDVPVREGWNYRRADAQEWLLEQTCAPAFVDIDPYGTCLALFDAVMRCCTRQHVVIAFHDMNMACVKQGDARELAYRYAGSRIRDRAWYEAEGHQVVLSGIAGSHGYATSHYTCTPSGFNMNGYVVCSKSG